MGLSRDQVLQALASFEQVQDVSVHDGAVIVTAKLDGVREELASEIRKAAGALPGVERVEIKWNAAIKGREIRADDPLPNVRNVILVMSGKGGVGKSTVATNLTMALARSGHRVGLLDADIYGPSIPTMMGVTGRPVSMDGKTIEPLTRFGVKLMSIGFLLEDPKAAVIWRGPMLHGALMQFIKDVAWGELDYLLLDLPPGTGDVALTLAQRLKPTGAVMVTTPQIVATDDVYKCVSMCRKVDIPIVGIVENMSWLIDTAGARLEIFGKGGGQSIAEFSEAPLLGQVPLDMSVREWGDKGTPVVQAAPGSAIARAFMDVAERLADAIEKRHEGGTVDAGPIIDRSGGTGRKRLPVVKG
jgi:ATP-binding protein involved in chromosome partitioning